MTGWVSVDESRSELTGSVSWTWWSPARVCEVRLQVPANSAPAQRNGSSGKVTAVRHDDVDLAVSSPGRQGEVAVAKLPQCVAAGTPFRFEVDFEATAGRGGSERLGRVEEASWWGSAVPLPAHSTKSGWVDPETVSVKGESTTSEVFDVTSLVVRTSDGDRVAGQGVVRGSAAAGLRREWRIEAPQVRDIAFVVGDLVTHRVGPQGCGVVGVTTVSQGKKYAELIATQGRRALSRLASTFDVCPYPSTVVAAVADGYGGMEFPGLTVVSVHDPVAEPRLVAHEIAHQFFYALVGNDQGRHPWLDEAFSTYAEALVNPASAASLRTRAYPAASASAVGKTMRHWNQHPGSYSTAVYARGATALLKARDTVGEAKFDAAIAAWVAQCSHKVCSPAQLRAHLQASVPEAERILAKAGAWEQ